MVGTVNIDEWKCLEAGEDNFELSRLELRVRGKKPLVLTNPHFTQLVDNAKQYLNVSDMVARKFIEISVLESPEPLSFEEHWKLVAALESHLNIKHN